MQEGSRKQQYRWKESGICRESEEERGSKIPFNPSGVIWGKRMLESQVEAPERVIPSPTAD